jgi:putative toxin-antitoxin system antitoxin component (TIGR02293 family)
MREVFRNEPPSIPNMLSEPAVAFQYWLDVNELPDGKQVLRRMHGGVLAKRLDDVRKRVGLTQIEAAEVVGLTARTLQRYGDLEILPLYVAEMVVRLEMMADYAFDIWKTDDGLRQWLRMSIPALENKVPLSLLTSVAGIESVHSVLVRISHGTYS